MINTRTQVDAAKRRIAEGQQGYLARMIALGGTREQLAIAHAADVEINALRAIVRRLGGEI